MLQVRHFLVSKKGWPVARTQHMTWHAPTKRWVKKYKGRLYFISAKQLGVPPSKEASWQAANAWWEAKQTELDDEHRQKEPSPTIKALELWAGRPMQSQDDLIATVMNFARTGTPTEEMRQIVLGPNKLDQLTRNFNSLLDGSSQPNRTVKVQIDSWLEVLRAKASIGEMDISRWDAYARNVSIFRDWIGGDSSIDLITAPKLEEFWAYLAGKIAEGRYSPSYAKVIFMSTRQFVRRLGEHDLIPMPGNITRTFGFGDGPKKVETLTTEEVRQLLDACKDFSDRTKLFLLLCLNCGMLQSDISDLGDREVDMATGIVKRPRSKRPDGPVTAYKLWPETLHLLREYANKAKQPLNDRGQVRLLLTERGEPLVRYWTENGKMRRYDIIQSAFSRLWEKVGWSKPIKLLRKTSASLLAKQTQYKFYINYFLSHSPKSVGERHYYAPSDDEFFEALTWLRQQFLGDRQCL